MAGWLTAGLLFAACDGDTREPGDGRPLPDSGTAATGGAGAGGAAATGGASAGTAGATCEGADCSCSDGLGLCQGECLDMSSDAANCGTCGHGCGVGGICEDGQCACPATFAECLGTCVDTQSDTANCGTCGSICDPAEQCEQGQCQPKVGECSPACAGGSTCSAGSCVCAAELDYCAAACVDTQVTPEHCGGCELACDASQVCQGGTCQCPAGLTACGSECVDLKTSTSHCGVCMQACASGEECMAGSCGTPTGEDGCDGPARNLTLREIAVYQTVKIPIMRKMAAVARAQRVSDVIQRRPTLFRVFVDVGDNFTARVLSARLTLRNDAAVDRYYAKQRISKASTDADTTSSFQIAVPPGRILADTSYSVELVECGDQASGTSLAPRFPVMGAIPLGTRKTGVLKIKLIPIQTNSHTPDLSEKTLASYREYLEAMYPIEKLDLKIGKQLRTGSPIVWSTMLEQVRSQRQADRAPTDVYYYGVVQPFETRREYTQSCRDKCIGGVGYIGLPSQPSTRSAVGLAYPDDITPRVIAHEVGHNHGRRHSPCAVGDISGVDPNYPHALGKIGTWGYDARTKVFMNPETMRDIMGYCNPKWISDYTYNALIERVATINEIKLELTDSALIARYRALIVDADGPRWSQPFPEAAPPFGEPEAAEVLDIDGQRVEQVTVFRTHIGGLDATTVLVPEVREGWHSIKLRDTVPLPFVAPITVPAPE